MHHSLFVVPIYWVEWEDLSLNQSMKRIKIIVLFLFIWFLLLVNRDNAYDEQTIIPQEDKQPLKFEAEWRDMIVEKVDNLLGDYITSEIIVDNCMEKTENYILCIKNVV